MLMSASAQKVSVFGLELGSRYDAYTVLSAVGNRGSFLDPASYKKDSMYSEYLDEMAFGNVRVNATKSCPLLLFQFLVDGPLLSASFNYDLESGSSEDVMKSVFDDAFAKFPDLQKAETDQPDTELYKRVDVSGTSVQVNRGFLPDGRLHFVEVVYYDAALLRAFADAVEALPKIQNEFYGLEFGETVYTTTLTKAVGDRGRYERMISEDGFKVHVFRDIAFAGKVWDFGEFGVANDGTKFYSFKVYNSYSTKGADKKESDKQYGTYKENLVLKYGSAEENVSDWGDKSLTFAGGNGISVSLFNENGKYSDGSAGRFVGLDYFTRSVVSELAEKARKEL